MKLILILAVLIAAPLLWADPFEPQASYTVCFTPGGDCTQQIVQAIDRSVRSIQVQSYSFTSRPIGKALVFARERGVQVSILFDKTMKEQGRNTLNYFLKHGIAVAIDEQPGIAHNKVMIIDGVTVITGSFNFTRAAQERNAENVLIINDQGLAKKYTENWLQHRSQSQVLAELPSNQPSSIERFWDWLISLFRRWFLVG